MDPNTFVDGSVGFEINCDATVEICYTGVINVVLNLEVFTVTLDTTSFALKLVSSLYSSALCKILIRPKGRGVFLAGYWAKISF